jgi:hypothetical protein
MRGEWGTARGEHRVSRVPKKEGAINPINPRGELAMLAFTQGENRAL